MKTTKKYLSIILIAVAAVICASCGSGKSESSPTKTLSLQGLRTSIIDKNLATNESTLIFEIIGASDGFSFFEPDFSVYAYADLENEYFKSAAKKGYIEIFGSKQNVIVNNNLVLYCDDESKCTEIIKLFKEWKTEATATSETKDTNSADDDDDNDTISLSDINSWLISDIWNDGFCDIYHYLEDGANSVGETMDIDFTIQQLKKKMELKQSYDEYINKSDNQNIKDIWTKLSPEIDRLFEIVTTNTITPESPIEFDTGLFVQYRDAFKNEVYESY